MIWKSPISLDAVRQRSKNTLVEHIGIEFIEIGDDYLKGTMPVDHRTLQGFGIMHGGASCVLAETLGSVAANYAVDLEKQYCVGLSINTNHIRSIKSGMVVGIATPTHIGKTTQVWNIDIQNEEKKLVSKTTLTMAVLTRMQ